MPCGTVGNAAAAWPLKVGAFTAENVPVMLPIAPSNSEKVCPSGGLKPSSSERLSTPPSVTLPLLVTTM